LAHALSEVAGTARSGRWSDFWVRLASASVLAPVALFCAWYGGLAWILLLLAALVGLGFEWAALARLPADNLGFLIPLFLVIAGLVAVENAVLGLVMLLLVGGLMIWRLGRFAGLGIPYAGIGGISLLWLRLQPGTGLRDVMFLVVVVWGTDIGAYLVGRIVGGRKLAPKISPGKTISGSIGGLVIGALAGALLAGRGHGIDFYALPAGILLSVFAQAGDLLESWIKRRLGVKDSGRTIPGHGGLFDRLDGFLAAAPCAAILALCVQGGLPLWR
jgi:phosphatidate cytidylyltransferase